MAVNAFPFDPVAGAPLYAAQAVRQALSALLGPFPASRPLGSLSGVRPGTSSSTVTVSGVTVTVQPHSGVVDLETASGAGPYFYWVDSAVTRTIGAASGSNPRIDILSVVTNDPTQDGTSTPGADLVITAGTPAATPAAPATPAGAMTLAQINVPRSGTGSPSVTWVAPYMVAAGGTLPVSGVSQYPASPYIGQHIYDTALQLLRRWNGTSWVTESVAKMLTRSSGSSTIANNTATTVAGWDTTPYDQGGITYASGVLTVLFPGLYTWSMTLGVPATTPAYLLRLGVLVNGTPNGSGQLQTNIPANSNSQSYPAGGPLTLSAGDAVTLQVQQTSGAAMAVTQVSGSLIRVGS